MSELEQDPREQAAAVEAALKEFMTAFETTERLVALQKIKPLIDAMSDDQKTQLREALSSATKAQAFNVRDPNLKVLQELEFDIRELLPRPLVKKGPEILAPVRKLVKNDWQYSKVGVEQNRPIAATTIERTAEEAQTIAEAMAKLMTADTLRGLVQIIQENIPIIENRLTAEETKRIAEKAKELEPKLAEAVDNKAKIYPREYAEFMALSSRLEYMEGLEPKKPTPPASPEPEPTPSAKPKKPQTFLQNLRALFGKKK